MNDRRRVTGIALWAFVAGVGAMGLAACARRPVELWEAVPVATDAVFDGLWFTDDRNGWMTGGSYMIEGGIVGRTRDGGRTWQFRSGVLGGTDAGGLGGVQFLDSLRGCAVGSGGVVVVTADGGESWRPVRHGRSPGDGLSDVQFLDDRNGWACGTASVVRTDDGGETWRPLVYGNDENGYLSANAIHFVDGSRGWLVGHSGTLARTEDGGLHWSRVPLPLQAGERPTLWDITFVGPNDGWAVGERGRIFHTSDAGATWTLQENGVPAVRVIPKGEPPRPREPLPELETEPDRLCVSAVRFLDAKRGWAVGYYADVAESVILGTEDGGVTWRVERVQPGELLRALFVLDPTHAWAAGDRARTAGQVVLRRSG
jgi:photosystem II stability/assembly factor-like uncharacterized protein